MKKIIEELLALSEYEVELRWAAICRALRMKLSECSPSLMEVDSWEDLDWNTPMAPFVASVIDDYVFDDSDVYVDWLADVHTDEPFCDVDDENYHYYADEPFKRHNIFVDRLLEMV